MSKLYNEIFVDLDGVLVDWLGGVSDALGSKYVDEHYNNKENEHERARLLAPLGPEFWANLKPMPDYDELWGYVKTFDPHILTAYPTWCEVNAENARVGKTIFNGKYMQVAASKFLMVKRDDKQLYAMTGTMQNVLIDDYKKNCKQWERAGGVAIHHKSATKTIERLKELGWT